MLNFVTSLAFAALSVIVADAANSSFAEKSFLILAGAGTDLFMLNFNPHSNPPTLTEQFRYPGVIRGAAYPWISRHPENRSESLNSLWQSTFV
jgi:hypothetical protein